MSETDTSGSETTGEEKKARRLSDAEWAVIDEQYELGTKGVTELADEYGVSRQTISKHFKDKSIVRGSRAHELAAKAGQAAAAAAVQAERYSDRRVQWIEETRLQGYNALKQATMLLNKRLMEVYKTPGATPAAAMDDLKALKLYQQSLIDNFDFRLNRLLNADEIADENALPQLRIEDLTHTDVVEFHQNNGMAETDEDIEDILAHVEAIEVEVMKE
jgi:AcrR family transcriptional regulator